MAQVGSDSALEEEELDQMRTQMLELEEQLSLQHRIAYATALFQGDITIRTLFEALAEGIIVVERGGRIIIINQRAEEMFGYSHDEVVGQPLNILLPEQFLAKHAQYVADYFQVPLIRPMEQRQDLTGKRKDGAEFPVKIGLSYLNTDAGPLALAFVSDITLRQQAERALLKRNAELDAFAYTLAHDLNVSLSILVGFSEQLAEDADGLSPAVTHAHLVTMAHTARRMSNIINELLLFASMRKEEVTLEAINTGRIVTEALKRLRHTVAEQRAEIVLPDSFPTALGHAAAIEEVWFNYLSNALKYGGQPPRLQIGGLQQADGYIKFWVKDNGRGLTSEQQARIFAPPANRDRPFIKGHGLGLSIVKPIVEKLGGQVGIESEVGLGSTFSFTLRAAAP